MECKVHNCIIDNMINLITTKDDETNSSSMVRGTTSNYRSYHLSGKSKIFSHKDACAM